jgi:hypothetical protein
VALVAADLRLPDTGGVEFLQRARALHPGASRVLLLAMDRYHTRVPFTELTALQRATALGLIDFAVVKGWVTPEEWLYPQVQEALTAWTLAHRPTHAVYRIVGEQWAPRSRCLDILPTTASFDSRRRFCGRPAADQRARHRRAAARGHLLWPGPAAGFAKGRRGTESAPGQGHRLAYRGGRR